MYLNVLQLAESLGVEESVVQQWIRTEGLPAIEDRGRLLFDRAQVTEWAAARGLASKAGFLAPTRGTPDGSLRLATYLRVGGIWRDVADPMTVLENVLSRLPGATPEVVRMLGMRLRAKGGITWAPVGGGFALPHLRSHVTLGRDSGLLAILLLREPLELSESTPDSECVRTLLFFVAPSSRAHLEMLAELSAVLTRGSLRALLLSGASDEAIFESLTAARSGDVSAKP